MPLSKEIGFLEWLPPVPPELTKQFGPLLDLCLKLNALSHKLLFTLGGKKIGDTSVLGTLSYVRFIQALQAAQVLGRLGLGQDCAVALRTAFEALCLLRACHMEPELALAFVDSDEFQQLKLATANIERLRREDSPDQALLALLEKGRKAIQDRHAIQRPKQVSAYDLAKAGGLLDVYESMWRTVSKYAHVSPRALLEYVHEGPGTTLGYGRDYREIRPHFTAIAEFSLLGQADYLQLFSAEPTEEYRALIAELHHVMAEL